MSLIRFGMLSLLLCVSFGCSGDESDSTPGGASGAGGAAGEAGAGGAAGDAGAGGEGGESDWTGMSKSSSTRIRFAFSSKLGRLGSTLVRSDRSTPNHSATGRHSASNGVEGMIRPRPV